MSLEGNKKILQFLHCKILSQFVNSVTA